MASHSRRGWTSSICIYTASPWAEKEGGGDGELGRGGWPGIRNVFCEVFILILHIHECPALLSHTVGCQILSPQ